MAYVSSSTSATSRRRRASALPVPEAWKHPAEQAQLRYISGDEPGYGRVKRRGKFAYIDGNSRPIKDEATLRRIRSLVLPPAWKDVWIAKHDDGHLQATGIDARGRKQYRYHKLWHQVRDQSKYEKVLEFGRALPKIRARVEADLKLPDLDRHKVLATVVRLLEITLIRVGNTEYARNNKSFGLTTMQDRHVQVQGCRIRFRFKGKSGKLHDIALDNCDLAVAVKKCREVPGQKLFQYMDASSRRRTVTSTDVNAYLKLITGENFTAKDFRTWAGTVLAAIALRELPAVTSARAAKKNIVQAIDEVAMKLGNTPTICRKCYVHPAIFDSYLDGSLVKSLKTQAGRALNQRADRLDANERIVMRLLKNRLSDMVNQLNEKAKG